MYAALELAKFIFLWPLSLYAAAVTAPSRRFAGSETQRRVAML